MDWNFWGPLLLGVGGLLTGAAALFKGFTDRSKQKDEAETATALAASEMARGMTALLEPLNARITIMNLELENARRTVAQMQADQAERDKHRAIMQQEINELRGGIQVLIAQLESNGITPRWKPRTGP